MVKINAPGTVQINSIFWQSLFSQRILQRRITTIDGLGIISGKRLDERDTGSEMCRPAQYPSY